MTELLIAPTTRLGVEHAVLRWHYSARMPTGRLWSRGVWENSSYIGAVVFGRGANDRMLRPYALRQSEGCELVRVALRQHTAPVTQIVAECLRQLRASNPGLRLVVSYADPVQDHVGVIYQAGGWFYLGTSAAQTEWVVNGVQRHARSISALRESSDGTNKAIRADEPRVDWLRRCFDPNAYPVTTPGKHRYVMPLDKQMRRLLARQRLQYPAAAGERSTVSTPASAGEGRFDSGRPLDEAQT